MIHRGTHEIGGSCVEVRPDRGDARMVIDLGMPLVQADRSPFDWTAHRDTPPRKLVQLGILPAVSGLYGHDEPGVAGVLISHAHQDHYGFLRYVHPDIPVYCSAGTRALMEVSNVFLDAQVNLKQIERFAMWEPFCISGFRVTPYLMDHSAPDAAAFAVETDEQKLFYSGDFRGHGRKRKLLDRLLNDPVLNVDCLLVEGTTVGRDEGPYTNEEAVEEAMREAIAATDSYTFVFASSQNLDRLVSVYRAALRSGAMFVIDLYTAFVLDRLRVISSNIPQFDWDRVRVLYSYWHAEKLARHDRRLLYRYRNAKVEFAELRERRGRVVFFGRDNSYFRQMLDHLGSLAGARAVYSMWPGYLARSDLAEVLASHGADLLQIHTSGHAFEHTVRQLADALEPACVVPMHTFHPEWFARTFDNAVLLKDGEELTLPVNVRSTKEEPVSKPVIRRYFANRDHLEYLVDDFAFLVRMIRRSGGEYDLQLRDGYFNVYYKGNSLARVTPTAGRKYRIEMHGDFVGDALGRKLAEHAHRQLSSATGGYSRFVVRAEKLRPFLQSNHVRSVAANITRRNYGEEITFEQVLITDNPPTDRFVIIDHQVTDRGTRGQMDLLALGRDSDTSPFHFLIIEVKLGKNPELKGKVGRQLSDYVAHVRRHIRDYVDCYQENYRQKKLIGLFCKTLPDEIEIEERVEGVVVTGGYSQLAEKAKKELERQFDIRVQVMKNVIAAT